MSRFIRSFVLLVIVAVIVCLFIYRLRFNSSIWIYDLKHEEVSYSLCPEKIRKRLMVFQTDSVFKDIVIPIDCDGDYILRSIKMPMGLDTWFLRKELKDVSRKKTYMLDRNEVTPVFVHGFKLYILKEDLNIRYGNVSDICFNVYDLKH